MELLAVDLTLNEKTPIFSGETTEEERMLEQKDAQGLLSLGASLVACATHSSTNEYTTETDACQANPLPSLGEIEMILAGAAREKLEKAYRDLQDTRARLVREQVAREKALHSAQERADLAKEGLDRLTSERTTLEEKAHAFIGGESLQLVLGKIHLAINAKQLDLEKTLAEAEGEVAEAQLESQAAEVAGALELELTEQEVQRLEARAPDIAQAVHLALAATQNLAAARQAILEGRLTDAAQLLELAKSGSADAVKLAEAETELNGAQKKELARSLIDRIYARTDQPGATRRIYKLMEEAKQDGVAEQVAPFANKALKIARDAANARFSQARPIADHLASEGYVPVIGDGRIEAWREIERNGKGAYWKLERILCLRGEAGWVTETLRNPVTQKGLPAKIRHSRWYRPAGDSPTT